LNVKIWLFFNEIGLGGLGI